MLAKAMKMHVLPAIAQCVTNIYIWPLDVQNEFMLVINFNNDDRVPCYVIIRLFETPNTIEATLVK
jgi:hypothetical protein